MRFLSRLQRRDRLASLLHATARLHADADIGAEDDALIDRLVLRACNSALSIEHPTEAAADMSSRLEEEASERA